MGAHLEGVGIKVLVFLMPYLIGISVCYHLGCGNTLIQCGDPGIILCSAFDWVILDVLLHLTHPGMYIRVAQQEFVHFLWIRNL